MKKKDKSKKRAKVCISPELVAINSIKKFIEPKSDVVALKDAIIEEAKKIEAGDISRIEQHLYSQALALNAMFDRAIVKLGEATTINEAQFFGQLGLKAQAQSRMTLTVLADLKNPIRATFIKNQNNEIQFNQQVNNQLPPEQLKLENEVIANELSKEIIYEKSNKDTVPQAISINSPMATMETVHRPSYGQREGDK
jgi:hypothetical protein